MLEESAINISNTQFCPQGASGWMGMLESDVGQIHSRHEGRGSFPSNGAFDAVRIPGLGSPGGFVIMSGVLLSSLLLSGGGSPWYTQNHGQPGLKASKDHLDPFF